MPCLIWFTTGSLHFTSWQQRHHVGLGVNGKTIKPYSVYGLLFLCTFSIWLWNTAKVKSVLYFRFSVLQMHRGFCHSVKNNIMDKYDINSRPLSNYKIMYHNNWPWNLGLIWFIGFSSLFFSPKNRTRRIHLFKKLPSMNNSACQCSPKESCMTEGWIHTWCPCSRSICTVMHHKLTCLSHRFVSMIWLTSSWE